MQRPDFNQIVETAVASLGGSPTSSEVEAAAIRLMESPLFSDRTLSGSVEAAQCSISVAQCSSRRTTTQRARVYDRVKKTADLFLEAVHRVAQETDLHLMPRVEFHIRDSSNLFAGHDAAEFLHVAEALSQGAHDACIDRIWGPFIDLTLQDGFDKVDLIPECLSRFDNLIPIVQIGTEQDGFQEESAIAIAYALAIVSNQPMKHRARIAIVVNENDQRAFGKRVDFAKKGVSISFSDPTFQKSALRFGQSVAATCSSCYELIQIENTSNAFKSSFSPFISHMKVDPTMTVDSGIVDDIVSVVHTSEGFPRFADLSNHVDLTCAIDPLEIVSLLRNKLLPFCFSSKRSGLVLELHPRS